MVTAAVTQNDGALFWASPGMKNNVAVVTAAVAQNEMALCFASSDMQTAINRSFPAKRVAFSKLNDQVQREFIKKFLNRGF